MEFFVRLCQYFFTSCVVWSLAAYYFSDSSPRQQKRLQDSLELIYAHLKKKDTVVPASYVVTYKNKTFEVGVLETEVNRYITYRIFINGEEAGCFHILRHIYKNTYYFEPINRRHEDEVRAIIRAAAKQLREQIKANKTKTNYYSEYSYFK